MIGVFNGNPVLISQSIPIYSLNEWIGRLQDPWEYSADGKECFGFDTNTKVVLRGIAKGALGIIEGGGYHGNLRNGAVRVGQTNQVKIVNSIYDVYLCANPVSMRKALIMIRGVFAVDDSNYEDVDAWVLLPNDLRTGMLKDLADFQKIVEDVVANNPCKTQLPKALGLFYKLCGLVNHVGSVDEVRELAFFIFHNPLFWTEVDRQIFTDLGWNIKRRVDKVCFNSNFPFNTQSTNMRGWQRRVQRSGNPHLLNVLQFKSSKKKRPTRWRYPTKIYNQENGFFDFQRNSKAHYQDHVRLMSLMQIERELFVALPHACSMFYYGLVELYLTRKQLFVSMFRADLFTLLKEEPTPCK
ncbi:hypothetical protein RHGRI_034491 [Rhododendron griersonianum]|uniref:Uncharacterized protein n=1 Tax=Rhododendron griersonianum TaxID=479676 RepID=A0AAV6I3K1_9ERIC|nr:hypothetical protein RHGRI_034491 [Rhododendron griersonianum]